MIYKTFNAMHFTQILKSFKNYVIVFSLILIVPHVSSAFPIFAQQAYENPREATGKIVCANCHLAQKPVSIDLPKSILPSSVFEATVQIPYDTNLKQVLGNGNKGAMNLGAIVILPEGFKLAPLEMLSQELREKIKGIYIQPYSIKYSNILVVGPISSNSKQNITFPVLSPNPSQDKNVHFIKYPIYVGANRGRGQIYPNGDKSNNNIYFSSHSGKIFDIQRLEKGEFQVFIKTNTGDEVIEKIPLGLELIIKEGQTVTIDQPLTKDPNIGGFGQGETEIVLQNPNRIKFLIAFFFTVVLAQIFFVLKKKQFEKVQASQMNF
uniref:Cytochrome f n=1 Tax=Boldia erythrosiphon TaxID=74908 RepID=A0A1Y9TLR0_9RHOD|nr:cytochrome f [Boldia erythrosiphon]ARO90541.1 cytochrome f [Boldia erythrosiphon]